MSDDKIQMGESYTREDLPNEVVLRMLRRADAEQNRYLNQVHIVKQLEKLNSIVEHLGKSFARTAEALEAVARTLNKPEEPEVETNDAGLPIPPWVDEPSGVDYDDTTPEDFPEA